MKIIFPLPFSLDFYLNLVVIGILATLIYVVFFFKKERQANQEKIDKKPPKTNDIMGRAQPLQRQTLPNNAIERQTEEPAEKPPTFAREIPKEELGQVFGGEEEYEEEDPDPDKEEIDWEDEETDLQAQRITSESDFAAGITFDELNKTAVLLQKDTLNSGEQKTVMDTAVKLSQTDLWEKITQAIPQATDKVAQMLDNSKKAEQPPEDWQSFDIRNFI